MTVGDRRSHSLSDPGTATATATASSPATPPDLFAGFLGDTTVHLRGYVVFGRPAGTVDLAAVATADRGRDLLPLPR